MTVQVRFLRFLPGIIYSLDLSIVDMYIRYYLIRDRVKEIGEPLFHPRLRSFQRHRP